MQIKARRSGSATAVVLDSALLAPDGNDGTFPDQARDLPRRWTSRRKFEFLAMDVK
ncbi:hypothetical protein ABZZ16_14660 [Streptomyces sp. NPDC006386]|uniref:hypothetical protein n=1 Tax=unclassified Streptomyces TaxID=2593676 RepID=UPI0033307B10